MPLETSRRAAAANRTGMKNRRRTPPRRRHDEPPAFSLTTTLPTPAVGGAPPLPPLHGPGGVPHRRDARHDGHVPRPAAGRRRRPGLSMDRGRQVPRLRSGR